MGCTTGILGKLGIYPIYRSSVYRIYWALGVLGKRCILLGVMIILSIKNVPGLVQLPFLSLPDIADITYITIVPNIFFMSYIFLLPNMSCMPNMFITRHVLRPRPACAQSPELSMPIGNSVRANKQTHPASTILAPP